MNPEQTRSSFIWVHNVCNIGYLRTDSADDRTEDRSHNWPRGYKTFFMLNSAEHEIYTAHKCINALSC